MTMVPRLLVLLLPCALLSACGLNRKAARTAEPDAFFNSAAGLDRFHFQVKHCELAQLYSGEEYREDTFIFEWTESIWGNPVSIIYPGTNKEFFVVWDTMPCSLPLFIRIDACAEPLGYEPDTVETEIPCIPVIWQERSGVKLGMTLEELQKLNRKEFNLLGFGWDYGGSVSNLNGGYLDEQIVRMQLVFEPTEAVDDRYYGDAEFRSSEMIRAGIPARIKSFILYQSPD